MSWFMLKFIHVIYNYTKLRYLSKSVLKLKQHTLWVITKKKYVMKLK